MKNMTTTFRASISPRFLKKVDRVFDASPATVFNELLQNARRAGATEVVVNLNQIRDRAVHVQFADDGVGMESPAALLCLADQGWDTETEGREDPAGMGFFCLSNFERVHVRSRDWSGIITPSVFRGEEDLHITVEHLTKGSCIQWEWDATEVFALKSSLQGAARHCGLMRVVIVTPDGDVTVIPTEFLDGFVNRRPLPHLGAEIGVAPNKHAPGATIYLNFYGVSLKVLPDYTDENWNHLHSLDVTLRVDVTRASELQLVLPARNAVKHNAGRTELLLECERTIYAWLSTSGEKHTLPFSVYERAKDVFGIDIGEARNELHFAANYYGGETVLVTSNVRNILGFRSLIENATEGRVTPRCQNPSMAGYSWYDALSLIEEVCVTIDGVEKENVFEWQNREEARPDDAPYARIYANKPLFEWVDSIKVEFKSSDGCVFICEPVALISGEDKESDFNNLLDSHCVYVTEVVRGDVTLRGETVGIITSAAFEANSYHDVDASAAEQEIEFETQALAALLKFIGDDQAAARCQLLGALRMISLDYATDDRWIWSIHSNPHPRDKSLTIVGPHLKTEVAECRKFVTAPSCNNATCELVSRTPVTAERIEAYMKVVRGYDAWGGALIVSDYALPVDLDAWEASQ